MASREDVKIKQGRLSARAASLRRFREIDWDFAQEQSESPFSDVHWHPCRFPSQVPALAIGRLTTVGQHVLDPFMGSGTTLVEAQRLGRRATGIDHNPISCLMTEAKTLRLPGEVIEARLNAVSLKLAEMWGPRCDVAVPGSVQGEKWYTARTLRDLGRLWTFVSRDYGEISVILRAAFSGILLPACRETRHWGYVCDNSTPKDNRERDVLKLFRDSLTKFSLAYRDRSKRARSRILSMRIIQDDAKRALEPIPDETFDALITSPPYLGVADYTKSQRLSMEWFGIEIERHRLEEIGARSKRHRHSAEQDYLTELTFVFQEAFRVMKKEAWGVVVFGKSPVRKVGRTEFISILKNAGFSLEIEASREIAQMRRQFPSIRDEFIFLVQKP